MNTVREIVDRIGRKELADALGLEGPKSIHPAVKAGYFPTSWYKAVKDLAKKEGIEVPESLFPWKIPANNDNHTAA